MKKLFIITALIVLVLGGCALPPPDIAVTVNKTPPATCQNDGGAATNPDGGVVTDGGYISPDGGVISPDYPEVVVDLPNGNKGLNSRYMEVNGSVPSWVTVRFHGTRVGSDGVVVYDPTVCRPGDETVNLNSDGLYVLTKAKHDQHVTGNYKCLWTYLVAATQDWSDWGEQYNRDEYGRMLGTYPWCGMDDRRINTCSLCSTATTPCGNL